MKIGCIVFVFVFNIWQHIQANTVQLHTCKSQTKIADDHSVHSQVMPLRSHTGLQCFLGINKPALILVAKPFICKYLFRHFLLLCHSVELLYSTVCAVYFRLFLFFSAQVTVRSTDYPCNFFFPLHTSEVGNDIIATCKWPLTRFQEYNISPGVDECKEKKARDI